MEEDSVSGKSLRDFNSLEQSTDASFNY